MRRLSSAKAEQEVTGLLQVLQRLPGARTHIVARMRDPVPSDCPLMIQPTVPFASDQQQLAKVYRVGVVLRGGSMMVPK